MRDFDSSEPACRVFAVEKVGVGCFRRIRSVIVALVVGALTWGEYATATVRHKTLIRYISSKSILREIDDSVADISADVIRDFEELSAGEFARIWLPELDT